MNKTYVNSLRLFCISVFNCYLGSLVLSKSDYCFIVWHINRLSYRNHLGHHDILWEQSSLQFQRVSPYVGQTAGFISLSCCATSIALEIVQSRSTFKTSIANDWRHIPPPVIATPSLSRVGGVPQARRYLWVSWGASKTRWLASLPISRRVLLQCGQTDMNIFNWRPEVMHRHL